MILFMSIEAQRLREEEWWIIIFIGEGTLLGSTKATMGPLKIQILRYSVVFDQKSITQEIHLIIHQRKILGIYQQYKAPLAYWAMCKI